MINPRSRDAPARNKAHAEYIGRRKGVILNEGMKHGLFGNVMGKKAEEIANVQEISRYIAAKTRQNTNTYRAVISFSEDDALRLGYDDKENWKALIERKLPDMAYKIGIPIQNLEYAAAFHAEKGHPHAHIIFWDKAQGVKKPYVHQSISNQIRVDLIKQVFADEMEQLQNLKNAARKAATDNVSGFFDGFLDSFSQMTPAQYRAAKEALKTEHNLNDGRLIYSRFPTTLTNELSADIERLAAKLPKTGRLNMKLMPTEVKSEIEALVTKIINNNTDCKREFMAYVHYATKICKYYSDNPDTHAKAEKSAQDEIMKRLSNVVLRVAKKLNQQERDFNNRLRQESYRRQMAESLVIEVFGILVRSANAEKQRLNMTQTQAQATNELSKQAKIELAKKYESDTGYDWER